MTDSNSHDSSSPSGQGPQSIALPTKPPVERRGYSLTGTYTAKLSGGRTRFVLPSVWREVIKVPIKVGPCPYLEGVRVYPLDEFERLAAQIEEQRRAGQTWARDLAKWLGRNYYEMVPDSAGRIEIPSQLVSSFVWPAGEVELSGGHSHILIDLVVADDAPAYKVPLSHVPPWM